MFKFSRMLFKCIAFTGCLWWSMGVGTGWSQPKAAESPTSRSAPAVRPESPRPSNLGDPLAFLPEHARIVVSLSNTRQGMKSLRETPLFRLLQDEEMQPLVNYVVKVLTGRSLGEYRRRFTKETVWQRVQRMFLTLTKFQLLEAARIFSGPHALAVVGIPSGSSPLHLGIVSKVTDVTKAKTLIENVLAHIPLSRSSYTQGQVAVSVIRGLENELHVAFVGSFALIATTSALMQSMLQRWSGQGKSVLQNPGYQNFLRKAAVSASGSVYLAVDRLLQDLAHTMGGQQNFLLQLLGLDVWDSVALTLGVHQRRFVSRLFFQFKKNATLRGINRLLALPVADHVLLEQSPEHSIFAGLARVPWVAIWDDIWATYQKIDPRTYQQLQRQLERFEGGILRISVRQLLEAFGESSASFLFLYPGGSLFPQYGQVFALKDAQRIEQTLTQILRLLSIQTVPQQYRGITWQRVRSSYETYRMMRMLPYSYRSLLRTALQFSSHLCFAFIKGRLYVTVSAHAMKTWIDALAEPSKALQTLRLSMKQQAEGRGVWTMLDGKSTITLLYNTFLAVAPFMGRMLYRTFRPLRGFSVHDLPRSHVLARYMRNGIFATTSTPTDTLWHMQSGLGLEWLLIGRMFAGAVERLFFQYRIPAYLRNVRAFSQLKQKSPLWEDQGLYSLAAERWSRLARYAVFQAVGMAAKQQAERFSRLYREHTDNLLAQLKKVYIKQSTDWGTWALAGDWKMHKEVLRVVANQERGATLRAGVSDLSSYSLSFEVKNPTRGFAMRFHLNSQDTLSLVQRGKTRDQSFKTAQPVRVYPRWRGRYGTSRRYYGSRYGSPYRQSQELAFSSTHFQKDQWVPVKIKVKENRISYWLGLKHYTRQTLRNHGTFGWIIPIDGQFEIRKFALTVHRAKDSASVKPYPSLQVQMTGHPHAIEVKEFAELDLSLKNVGRLAASHLKVQVRLSPHLHYLSASSLPGVIVPVWKEQTRTVEFVVPQPLDGGQSLRIRIRVQAKKAGSAWGQAFLQFSQMVGEISLQSRIHVAGDANDSNPQKARPLP